MPLSLVANWGVGFYLTWHLEFKNGIFQVKSRYHYAKKFVSWGRYIKFCLHPCFFEPVKKGGGQILPNLTFRIQKWHISGKVQVPLCKKKMFLDLGTWNFGSSHVFSSPYRYWVDLILTCLTTTGAKISWTKQPKNMAEWSMGFTSL